MEARRVKVGFVGAGRMANAVHYPSLAEMEDAEIVAICDLIDERLHSTADKYGVEKRYKDYRKMLEEVELDAVYVIMPPHQLFDICMDVLERGLNLFIEKPPGVTAFQAWALAEKAEEKEAIAMVGFNRRFAPHLEKALERAEELGGPAEMVVSAFHKDGIPLGPYYRGAIDILRCDAIHAVDLLCHVGGRVKRVVGSRARRVVKGYEDSFVALVEFESGADGILVCSWTAGSRQHWLEVHCRGSSARVDLDNTPSAKAQVFAQGKEVEAFTASEAAGSNELRIFYGYFAENRHFIDCVKSKQRPISSMEDAARSMELAEMIYRHSV